VRPASDLFGQVIGGTRSVRLIVDVFYDDEPTFEDLPVSDWSLAWDLESELKSTGDLTVAYTSQAGESLTPRGFLDTLAPYGQQVNVLVEVSAGAGFTEVLQLGRYRIAQAPEASDTYFQFLGRTLSAGSLVKLTVDDLLSNVKRAGFHQPEPPILTDTIWGEIQRITGLPVNPSLPDKATPSGLIYQNNTGGRLAAFQDLTSALGGIGVTNSFGEVTAIPFDVDPTPVAVLAMGDNGRVISASTGLDADNLYNVVVGEYQYPDGTPIPVEPAKATGTLAPDGPFGESTFYDKSDTIDTLEAAQARVQTVLNQLIASNTFRITLSCIADYRLEQGDVATFQSMTGAVTGRIISIKFTADGLMEVVLDVRP
jgi:hypothetical protein